MNCSISNDCPNLWEFRTIDNGSMLVSSTPKLTISYMSETERFEMSPRPSPKYSSMSKTLSTQWSRMDRARDAVFEETGFNMIRYDTIRYEEILQKRWYF
mmetsp:Transcript_18661/g.45065  ORF Transcript_18661/g.45065 Transcript_18661/m.45065 type:complete len:100 (+) Transcript_18661:1207-1506(+)